MSTSIGFNIQPNVSAGHSGITVGLPSLDHAPSSSNTQASAEKIAQLFAQRIQQTAPVQEHLSFFCLKLWRFLRLTQHVLKEKNERIQALEARIADLEYRVLEYQVQERERELKAGHKQPYSPLVYH